VPRFWVLPFNTDASVAYVGKIAVTTPSSAVADHNLFFSVCSRSQAEDSLSIALVAVAHPSAGQP
jgi:hypothetical protein